MDFESDKPPLPAKLKDHQIRLIRYLTAAFQDRKPFADYYHGALKVLADENNPDRIAQSAHSLRELLEKAPIALCDEEPKGNKPDLRALRSKIERQFERAFDGSPGDLVGKPVTGELAAAIATTLEYVEGNKRPTRRERFEMAFTRLDPFSHLVPTGHSHRAKSLKDLWDEIQKIAHHGKSTLDREFADLLREVEEHLLEVFAPSTSENLKEIQRLMAIRSPTDEDASVLDRMLRKRGANYLYFFAHASEPNWVPHLQRLSYLTNPPDKIVTPDGNTLFPHWPPISYLQKVAESSPKVAVDVLLPHHRIDNPRVLQGVCELIVKISDPVLAIQLSRYVEDYVESPMPLLAHGVLPKILLSWIEGSKSSKCVSILLLRKAVCLLPDPKAEDKIARRQADPNDFLTSLEPRPRFGEWEYSELLKDGVYPLAERAPMEVAQVLVEATSSMIELTLHPTALEQGGPEDLSEVWCPRLDVQEYNPERSKAALIRALVHACEQVFERAPTDVERLFNLLLAQRWLVFIRLRHHLLAKYPSKQTLPWIRECLISHTEYGSDHLPLELQQLIRTACEHFGEALLTRDERCKIFDSILAGPPPQDYREWRGDDQWNERLRYFQRLQLTPFERVLFGKYREELDRINAATRSEIKDSDYQRFGGGRSGFVSEASPFSEEKLAQESDEALLKLINEWDEAVRRADSARLVVINLRGLSEAFKKVFAEQILPDATRMEFWLKHLDDIQRPLFVRRMLEAFTERAKGGQYEGLNSWLDFAEWVLDRPNLKLKVDDAHDEENWRGCRLAVTELLDACFSKENPAPTAEYGRFAAMLTRLCTEFDQQLELGKPIFKERDDQLTEAINTPRGRALSALVEYAFWVRKAAAEAGARLIQDILEIRFSDQAEYPLTLPERALLGMQFGRIWLLDPAWAKDQIGQFFPRDHEKAWAESFSTFIRFNRAHMGLFSDIEDELRFAVEHLDRLKGKKGAFKEACSTLGEHLFVYYVWEKYSLAESDSMLARFYEETTGQRTYWAALFEYVGRTLKNSGPAVEAAPLSRILAYLDWRIQAKEPLELREFTHWLEAEAIGPSVRLDYYRVILEILPPEQMKTTLEVDTLNDLLESHPEGAEDPNAVRGKVVDCFAKFTDALARSQQIYISEREARPILKAGLNHPDPKIIDRAKYALNNLLKHGHFGLLDLARAD